MLTGPSTRGSAPVLHKILDTALSNQPFTITGTDWPTRDGTGIRDYLHVWDLAHAHLLTLRRFDPLTRSTARRGYLPLDLGTGRGTTVRGLVSAVEAVLGHRVPVRCAPRRPGDTAGCFARSRWAQRHLGWQPSLSLEAAVRHLLMWRTAQQAAGPSPGAPRH
jgi:UDP-glucose 4-epimerase